MPELPEVETTRRGIAPLVQGRRVAAVQVRQKALRWPVPDALGADLPGQTIAAVGRRAKYLLLHTGAGTAIIHLGMSGSLRVVPAETAPTRHDHLDIVLDDGQALRLHDPRRFGAVLWTREDPATHPRLARLGPEPLDEEAFDAEYLYRRARGRRQTIKAFLMDAHTVVGVGNIYANEALFAAGIRPTTAAGRISRARYGLLVAAVRQVLREAIAAGGTTLRDFAAADGRPGYFRQRLRVYDRAGEPCLVCGSALRAARIGQRASVYCSRCQR